MKLSALLAVTACLTPVTALAQTDAPLIPRETLFGNPEKTQGQFSPDGAHISYLAPLEGVLNVWAAPSENISAGEALTDDDGRGIAYHTWAEDSETILYGRDTGGDENYHVFALDIESGESMDLTPYEGVRGQIMQTSEDEPGAVLIGMNDRDPALHDVYRVDLESGERELVFENPGYGDIFADDDLEVRSALRQTDEAGYEFVSLDGDEPETLFEIGPVDALSVEFLRYNDAGDGFYMLDTRGRDKAALTLLDAATGEVREVIAESDAADVTAVLFHPTSDEPLAYGVNKERMVWTALNEETGADLAAIDERLTGDFSIQSMTNDNRHWLVSEDSAEDGPRVWRFDTQSHELTELYTPYPALAEAPLQPMHSVVIPARDGQELVSYYTLPPGSDADGDGLPEEAVPMVLWVHGGPWARDRYGYDSTHQWLANRGYAVMSVNYRGSTGFGKNFVDISHGEWSGAMHDDLLDAVDWAVNQGIAIEDEVAIGGGSYGGYATLVGMTFTPDEFACGVDIVGPSNMVTLMESFPAYWGPSLNVTFYRALGDITTEEGRESAMAVSPITRVDDIERPLLIGQGANDPRVNVNESEQIVAAMQEKDLPVTYALFPDEGHGFRRPENRLAFNAVAESFLAREDCLGGRSEPIGDAFSGSSLQIEAGASEVPGLENALEDFEPTVAN